MTRYRSGKLPQVLYVEGCRRARVRQSGERTDCVARCRSTLDPSEYRDIVRRALAEDVGAGDITTDATVHRISARGACSSSRPTACWPGSTSRSRRSVSSEPWNPGDASQAGRRALPGRRDIGGLTVRLARCSSASGRRSIFFSGCPGSPRGRASSSTRPPAGSSCSTPARRRRRCARWRSTRCGRRRDEPPYGLFDAVLIKDNHIRLAGGVEAPSLASARAGRRRSKSKRRRSPAG